MEKQFTYLIGAGASALTLPVISDFDKRLLDFAMILEQTGFPNNKFPENFGLELNPSDVKLRFTKDIRWLALECRSHASVDTFARKLFLSNRNLELLKLKAIVSEFLLFQQLLNGIDKRYDAFFAALLDKSETLDLLLPNNIKILSWNYDKQIEYSIAQFHYATDNNFIEDFLQIFPKRNNTIDTSKFCVFKLNGSIGGTLRKDGRYIPLELDYDIIGKNFTSEIRKEVILNILYRYTFVENRIKMFGMLENKDIDEFPTINYSWEKNKSIVDIRLNANNATRETEILVIIGYSFPTFNRLIDKNLLKNMGRLRKVFIQSPEDSIDGVIQRFKSLYQIDIEIEPVTNVEEFYIPFEY